MLACIHYSQLPLFCCLFSLRLHSFVLCLSPSRHRAAPECLSRGVFAPRDPSLSSSTATGRERLLSRGPIEAWLQLHLHHCHRFREENQELEEETEFSHGPKTEWAVIHPITSTSTSHLSSYYYYYSNLFQWQHSPLQQNNLLETVSPFLLSQEPSVNERRSH